MHCALKNWSFTCIVPLGVAWPPPVTLGPELECDLLWFVEILPQTDLFEVDLCAKLCGPLSAHHEGYMFCAVCLLSCLIHMLNW